MLYTKMNDIIDEVNAEVAEREELVECIAICLLARKNMFILGETGQAKSYAINEFRKRITGAKQFEYLMSKQTDEEQIFGRLDLSSIIPDNLPKEELMKDEVYSEYVNTIRAMYEEYKAERDEKVLKEAADKAAKLSYIKRIVCSTSDNTPRIITKGKIPDSHIVFLDEIFKSADGILNSLLTALNERVYTNEGQTVSIPVISVFSASNEIPDFKDPAQAILKPLYDRFELKVLTEYVQEPENRMRVLKNKQSGANGKINATISLHELEKMQKQMEKVIVPDSINELMDNVLCELRRNGVRVSDRKYFGFTPIVKAKAYLSGNTEVAPKDLMVLKNYFWDNPSERETVEKILSDICENPIGTEVDKLLDMANESKTVMEETLGLMTNEGVSEDEKVKAYVVFSRELLKIYIALTALRETDLSDSDLETIVNGENELEAMLSEAAKKVGMTYIPLSEQKIMSI